MIIEGRVLVALSSFCEDDNAPRRLLESAGVPFVEHKTGKRITPEEILAMGTDWCGIVAGVEPYTSETLSRLPLLRCLSRVGVGVDAIDGAYTRAHGIKVCNTPDAPTATVAELTICMMLDCLHLVSFHDRSMKQNLWVKKTGRQLFGNTVGIIGLGRIGRAVAERLKSFGVRLVGYDVCEDAIWAKSVGLVHKALPELLAESDIVTIHAAPAKLASPLIGQAEIALMKRGSVLVNTSRGNLVDDTALNRALVENRLFGAGMDVYPSEPYSGPLCSNQRAILTPHIATLTTETRVRMETEAVSNLLDVLKEAR